MKKILKINFTAVAFILCIMFLLCGIEGINNETSYIISGERQSVVKVQSRNGQSTITSSAGNRENTVEISLNSDAVSQVARYAKYFLFPPLGNILFTQDYISKNI